MWYTLDSTKFGKVVLYSSINLTTAFCHWLLDTSSRNGSLCTLKFFNLPKVKLMFFEPGRVRSRSLGKYSFLTHLKILAPNPNQNIFNYDDIHLYSAGTSALIFMFGSSSDRNAALSATGNQIPAVHVPYAGRSTRRSRPG